MDLKVTKCNFLLINTVLPITMISAILIHYNYIPHAVHSFHQQICLDLQILPQH